MKLSILIIRRSDIRDMFLEIGELWPKGLKSDEEKSVILKAWLKRIRIPLDCETFNWISWRFCFCTYNQLPVDVNFTFPAIIKIILLVQFPFAVFFFFAITNLCLFEVIPFIMSCFNISHGMDVYVFPFQPPNVWNINSTFVFLITYLWEVSCSKL